MATIRVRAVGSALVQDFDALEHGVKRFIGRTVSKVEPAQCDLCARAMGDEQVCSVCSRQDAPHFPKHEFRATGQVAEVSARAEHVMAVREGSLECADEASAALCGVPMPAKAAPKAQAKDKD